MITLSTETLVLIACVVAFIIGVKNEWGWLLAVSGIIGIMSGIVACENTEWRKAERAEERAQAQRDATPHVIREADGCKVYAWKGGDWHYFTRCSPGDKVTTERHYTVKCGYKNQQNCDRKEVTVTEPEK